MGIVPRPRHGAHVDKLRHAMRLEQTEEFIDRPRRVSDRQNEQIRLFGLRLRSNRLAELGFSMAGAWFQFSSSRLLRGLQSQGHAINLRHLRTGYLRREQCE